MDFATAKLRVRETLSLPVEDDARVGEFVNEACADFARDASPEEVPFTLTTVANQSDYALDAAAFAFTTPNDGILRFVRDNDTTEDSYDIDVRGTNTVVLDPIPSSAGTVKGWVVPRPELLTSGVTSLPFNREWHRAIVYRACQLAAEWDRQDATDVQTWEGKYELEVAKARKQRARMRTPARRGLKPSASLRGTRNGSFLTLPPGY